MAKWIQRIRQWYDGEIEMVHNEPDSPIVFIGVSTRRHWTADLAHGALAFYLKHWQWLWGTALVVVGLVLA